MVPNDMSEGSLLATKLSPPAPRRDAVSRSRLLRLLDRGLQRKLTLVSSSAGSGKTTLLAEWVRTVQAPVGWLSLDAGDNDPTRFASYLTAALSRGSSENAAMPSVDLSLSQLGGLEAHVVRLINRVADQPDDMVLVLDDYHLIEEPSLHQALWQLIEHAPAHLHLYLASRADPPLPLARLRAQDQLVEVRVADLRFRTDEASAFLTSAMGLDLEASQVSALASRTEGWAAGLQLAGISLRQVRDRAQFVAGFAGSDAYVADYLLEEVLAAQPEPVNRFLMCTSILPRLTAPLCEAVTGQQGAQEMLEKLYAENLFVTALDSERRWYAYHQLFADLLRHKLGREIGDAAPALHVQAARWHLANGSVTQAVPHLLEAGQLEAAADAIEQVADALLRRSETATLAGWMACLPKDLVLGRPGLCLWYAWTQMLRTYSLSAIVEHLEVVARRHPERLLSLHAYIALFKGELVSAAQLAQRALLTVPDGEEGFLSDVATWVLTVAQTTEVDLYAGGRAMRRLATAGQASGSPFTTALTLNTLAELYLRQGKLHEAEETYERVLGLTVDASGRSLPISGMALIGLAEIAREWNDLALSRQRIVQGFQRLEGWGETATIDGYVALSALLLAEGDERGAVDAARRAHDLARASDATELDDQITSLMQARLCARLGDLDQARRWLSVAHGEAPEDWDELESDIPYLSYHILHHRALTLVRIQLAERQFEPALALLDRLLAGIERYGWKPSRREMEVHLLRAIALLGMGKMAPALMALQQALIQAEPGGYVRSFVDEGPPMARLLRGALERGIQVEYVRSLLAAFPEQPPAPGLVEPLTEREAEVLRLIADGLTNQQIADRLIVAVGTVKAHSSNIYGKLGVRNRLQAVSRAQELGLL